MRTTILIAMMCAVTACATDLPNATSTSDQALICDPNCDPGNFQYLVSRVIGESNGLGEQVSPIECYHYNGGYDPDSPIYHQAHDECAGTWQDPWGSRYRVWCSSIAPCTHDGCGWPGQLPCP